MWEYHLPKDYRRPVDSDSEMEAFIRSKYEYSKVGVVHVVEVVLVDLSYCHNEKPSLVMSVLLFLTQLSSSAVPRIRR